MWKDVFKRMCFLWVCIASLWLSGTTSTETYQYPFQDPNLPWDDRVDDLVGRLTLEELLPQTMAIYGKHVPGIDRLNIKPYVWITECLHGQHRTDGTAFPQAIGLAASFSPELIFNVSEAISFEVRAHWNENVKHNKYETFYGLSCFSPVINILRHPLWGRNQETYGEDPYLSGELVRKYVAGLQGSHPRYVRANAGCKHFDVHNGPENIPVSRLSFNAKVSMRDWRTTFLPAFKACVEAGTYNLMCSYNSINGTPACANKELLTDILRNEWGFSGYVVSDALAIFEIIYAHHYSHDRVATAALTRKAGCNLELSVRPANIFRFTLQAIKDNLLTESEFRESMKPLFYTRMRLGEFDPANMNPYNSVNMSHVQSPAHRNLAEKAAMMSFVLLKNEKLLPLTKKHQRLAVVGPMADNLEQLYGNYATNINASIGKTPLQGLKPLAQAISYGAGCKQTKCDQYNATEISTAISGSDLIVVCLGTGQSLESESNDRSSIDLPGHQLELLQDAVRAAGDAPVILLLFNAGPLDITWAKDTSAVAAIVEGFFPAQSAGTALYKMLTARGHDAVPAGRLPMTWPAYLSQVPNITNYDMAAGFTYRYFKGDPLYPFGYGLSYSKFEYSALQLSKSKIKPGESVGVSVNVKNLGPYDADEVVQIYMSWGEQQVISPKLQLVGIQRVSLSNQKIKLVKFTISDQQMALWADDQSGFKILPGDMRVYAGGQQPNQKMKVPSNILQATFTITAAEEKSSDKLNSFNSVIQN